MIVFFVIWSSYILYYNKKKWSDYEKGLKICDYTTYTVTLHSVVFLHQIINPSFFFNQEIKSLSGLFHYL